MDKGLKSEALPGMETADQDRATVAAEELGFTLSAELVRAPASIEQAAGNLETFSPLFRGSEASPQFEMFKGGN